MNVLKDHSMSFLQVARYFQKECSSFCSQIQVQDRRGLTWLVSVHA